MTTNAIEKIVDVEVGAVVADTGNRGPQWKLVGARIPALSQYQKDYWIDSEGVEQPAPGTYRCRIGRGKLLNNRDGTPKDGTHDYDYRWYINAFGLDPNVAVTRDVPTQTLALDMSETAKRQAVTPHPLPPGTPPPLDVTRNSIERQVVFKAAVDIAVALLPMAQDENAVTRVDLTVQAYTILLWPVLQGIGNPSPDAVAAPESDEPPLYGTGMLPTPPPETQDAPDDGLSEAVREFRELATKHGWTGTMVKKWTGMSSQEYVNREPAPTNQFEIDGRWRDLTANCMDAWSKTVQPPAEDDQEKEPLPW